MHKMRKRQEKELEQMLGFEMKMQEIQEERDRRGEEEKRREEARKRAKEKRAREITEERRTKELKKKAMEDAEEERRLEVARQMFERERALRVERERKERFAKIEARNREEERLRKQEQEAVGQLLESAKKPGPGTVKFYFATREGALPWLDLSSREAQEVRAGQLCVVRSGPVGTHTYRLLPADAAKRVHQARPDAIAFAPQGVLG